MFQQCAGTRQARIPHSNTFPRQEATPEMLDGGFRQFNLL